MHSLVNKRKKKEKIGWFANSFFETFFDSIA